MKKTIQTKRTQSGSSNYRVLYAKTGRKRRLHAATATIDPHVDLESDVPNVGIGRALLVILVLHILAIAAIYVHSTFFGNDGEATAGPGKTPPAAAAIVTPDQAPPAREPVVEPVAPVAPAVVTPEVDPASERYIVVTGDTYHRISQVRNVDEHSLRALNSNRPLRAGVVLDLPAELSSRPVVVDNTPTPQADPPSLAVIDGDKTPKPAPHRASESGNEPDVSNAPKAVVVKPTVQRAEATDVSDSGVRYTIKSGDTLWRISNRYKVSREALLKLNGIKDANKLYAGREIKIPKK